MRKYERQITERAEIEQIIRQANICRLGLCDQNRPYIVPMNFGYQDQTLYFHCASEGRKIELLKINPQVCFEIDLDHGLVSHKQACHWSYHYQSVIGYGQARFITERADKIAALNIIMANYSKGTHRYETDMLDKTMLFSVQIDSMTGKSSL